MTTVRYFIPEDGDSEYHPNVFLAPKPRQPGAPPTLAQVKDAFPLPGRYHFRFKSPLIPGGDREKGGMAVWLDCVHDSQTIPTWQNSIVAKVTRVGVEDDDDDDDDDEAAFAAARAGSNSVTSAPRVAPQVQQPPRPSPPPPSEPFLDVFETPSMSAVSSMPSSAQSSTGNLFDLPMSAPASTSASLLDMDAPVYHSQSSQNHAHHDFFGMTAHAPATPVQPAYGQQQHQQQAPQQQAYRPQPPQPTPQQRGNTFDSFGNQQGPFGGLGTPWK